ncbi:MAG: 4Fe-4S binding protein, partial [Eggerthellaceae bacterium]|nr:4Fe-4S binding protein [Eggerthellaceae bacterium]
MNENNNNNSQNAEVGQKAVAIDEGKKILGMKRRDFILGCGVFAGLLVIGGLGVATPAEALVRPPGAQDESQFLALCTRCDRCRSVCPTEAIAPVAFEGGLASIRTPMMNFK